MDAPEDDCRQSLSLSPSSSYSSSTETVSVKKETVKKRNPKFKVTSSSISKIACKSQDLPTVPPPIKSVGTKKSGSAANRWIVNPNSGKYQCRICAKEYFQPQNCRAHFRSAHMKVTYTCPATDCGKIFGVKANYNRHYERVHIGIRYQCKICMKVCTQKFKLANHVKNAH